MNMPGQNFADQVQAYYGGKKMKEKVKVKISRDAKYFYIQYGGGAEWEKVKISDLPWAIKALLNTFTSGEYEAIIEAEEYTGI